MRPDLEKKQFDTKEERCIEWRFRTVTEFNVDFWKPFLEVC